MQKKPTNARLDRIMVVPLSHLNMREGDFFVFLSAISPVRQDGRPRLMQLPPHDTQTTLYSIPKSAAGYPRRASSFLHYVQSCGPSNIICSNFPPVTFTRSFGERNICDPSLPPLIIISSSVFAVSSTTVGNCFFMPSGVHPPRM